MKRVLFLITLFSVLIIHENKAGIIGGFISGKQLSGYNYELSVTIYLDRTITNSECNLEVFIDSANGTGWYKTLQLSNGTSCGNCSFCGELVESNIYKYVYKANYNFPKTGRYILSYERINRVPDILNISNSLEIPFFVKTELYVFDTSVYCASNSLIFGSFPILNFSSNSKYESDLPIVYSDGDSLTYNFVSCKGHSGNDIVNYFLPNDININTKTGKITWVAQPSQIGLWAIAVNVNKYKRGVLVGATTFDFLLSPITNSATNFSVGITSNPPSFKNADSIYVCSINPSDTLEIIFTHPTNYILQIFSEVAKDTLITTANGTIYKWFVQQSEKRIYPFKFTARVKKNGASDTLQLDYIFLATVLGSNQSSCAIPPNLNSVSNIEQETELFLFPNPNNGIFTLRLNVESLTDNLLKIQNTIGDTIYLKRLTKNEIEINLSEFPKGVYVIQVGNERKKIILH